MKWKTGRKNEKSGEKGESKEGTAQKLTADGADGADGPRYFCLDPQYPRYRWSKFLVDCFGCD
jgi:hypothetical protein